MAACGAVEALSAIKEEVEEGSSPLMRQVFAWLFPFGPGWNSGAYAWSMRNDILIYLDQFSGRFISPRTCIARFLIKDRTKHNLVYPTSSLPSSLPR